MVSKGFTRKCYVLVTVLVTVMLLNFYAFNKQYSNVYSHKIKLPVNINIIKLNLERQNIANMILNNSTNQYRDQAEEVQLIETLELNQSHFRYATNTEKYVRVMENANENIRLDLDDLNTNVARKDHSANSTIEYLQFRRACSLAIPCTLWLMWDKGWDNVPPMQKMCLNSFKINNPDFTIRALNLQEAEQLINRSHYYPNTVWRKARIQAKSDIIRLEIIARYGGIWADATVYCMDSISQWINEAVQPTGMFVFERKDRFVTKNSRPWIASWFIAGSNTSRMLHIWRDTIREGWNSPVIPYHKYGYFWCHRMFRELVLTNTEFSDLYRNMTHIDAGGAHCWASDKHAPHLYKTRARACTETFDTILQLGNHTTAAVAAAFNVTLR